MRKIKYREKSLWKALVYTLNQATQHKLSEIYSIYETSYDKNYQCGIGKYLYYLQEYNFLRIEKRFNQNKKCTEKIIMNRKIPRKLKPELFREFKEKPWLFWFMFPE